MEDPPKPTPKNDNLSSISITNGDVKDSVHDVDHPHVPPDPAKAETLAKLVQDIVSQSPFTSSTEDPFIKLESNFSPTLIAKGLENAKCWKAGKLTEIMKQINASGPSVSGKIVALSFRTLTKTETHSFRIGTKREEVLPNKSMPFPNFAKPKPRDTSSTNVPASQIRNAKPTSSTVTESKPHHPFPIFSKSKPVDTNFKVPASPDKNVNFKHTSAATVSETITSPTCPERKRFKFNKNTSSSQSHSQPDNALPKVHEVPKISLFQNPNSELKQETTAMSKLSTTETKTVTMSNGLGSLGISSINRPSLFSELPPNDEEQLRRSINFPVVPPAGLNKPNPEKQEVITVPDEEEVKPGEFRSAYEQLLINDKAKGIRRVGLSRPPPKSIENVCKKLSQPQKSNSNSTENEVPDNPALAELMTDDRMKNIDPKMAEAVLNEVVEIGASTDWNDIAGLEGVKRIIREIIIWPMMRPDIFTGLRGPPKGILLFGPPGTGKTMIGRLIATQSNSTFFNISASSLTSKWIGDGEKMVRALFQVARVKQPAVIFIDEIDSILTQRSDTEHESSRRLKTEFLIQFDGCGTKSEDRILVIGVTNRPQELDEAARRRLVKRIYIPLPDIEGRKQLVQNLLTGQNITLSEEDFGTIAEITAGYSGADMASLCQEASYGPIRDIGTDIQNIDAANVRPMLLQDFERALKQVKASVASSDLTIYENWDKQFGVTLS